jgi:hypothetical protein
MKVSAENINGQPVRHCTQIEPRYLSRDCPFETPIATPVRGHGANEGYANDSGFRTPLKLLFLCFGGHVPVVSGMDFLLVAASLRVEEVQESLINVEIRSAGVECSWID